MDAKNRILLLALFAGVTVLTACASTQAIAPVTVEPIRHYGSPDRYEHVVLDVRSDREDDSVRLKEIAIAVAAELGRYLEIHGIQTSSPQDNHPAANARLTATISQTHPAERYQHWKYYIALNLADVNGKTIDSAAVFHNASLSKNSTTAQQLAVLIADDMLIIWHSGMRYRLSNFRAKTLRSTDSDATTLFTWDPFPVEHITRNMTDYEIADVTYEFRLTPQDFLFPNSGPAVFRIDGLLEPVFELPLALPVCETARWAVRTHFTLNGHARVTEWSGDSYQRRYSSASMLRPSDSRGILDHFVNKGEFISRDPENGLTCRDIDAGNWTSFWSQASTTETASGTAASSLNLKSLQPGQSIATIAAPGKQCGDHDCYRRENDRLAACIRHEFSRRTLSIAVRDFSGTLKHLPATMETPPESLNTEELLALITAPANRSRLLENGVGYVLAATAPSTSIRDTKIGTFAAAGGGLPVIGMSVDDVVTSSIDIDIIDVSASAIVGSLESRSSTAKGWAFAFIGNVPIALPHGYLTDTEAKVCEDLASKLSFALALGDDETDWRRDHFDNLYDPMW